MINKQINVNNWKQLETIGNKCKRLTTIDKHTTYHKEHSTVLLPGAETSKESHNGDNQSHDNEKNRNGDGLPVDNLVPVFTLDQDNDSNDE